MQPATVPQLSRPEGLHNIIVRSAFKRTYDVLLFLDETESTMTGDLTSQWSRSKTAKRIIFHVVDIQDDKVWSAYLLCTLASHS